MKYMSIVKKSLMASAIALSVFVSPANAVSKDEITKFWNKYLDLGDQKVDFTEKPYNDALNRLQGLDDQQWTEFKDTIDSLEFNKFDYYSFSEVLLTVSGITLNKWATPDQKKSGSMRLKRFVEVANSINEGMNEQTKFAVIAALGELGSVALSDQRYLEIMQSMSTSLKGIEAERDINGVTLSFLIKALVEIPSSKKDVILPQIMTVVKNLEGEKIMGLVQYEKSKIPGDSEKIALESIVSALKTCHSDECRNTFTQQLIAGASKPDAKVTDFPALIAGAAKLAMDKKNDESLEGSTSPKSRGLGHGQGPKDEN